MTSDRFQLQIGSVDPRHAWSSLWLPLHVSPNSSPLLLSPPGSSCPYPPCTSCSLEASRVTQWFLQGSERRELIRERDIQKAGNPAALGVPINTQSSGKKRQATTLSRTLVPDGIHTVASPRIDRIIHLSDPPDVCFLSHPWPWTRRTEAL